MHGRELQAELEAAGWVLPHQRGTIGPSKHPDRPDIITVPHKPLNPGLVAHIRSKARRGHLLLQGTMNRGK